MAPNSSQVAGMLPEEFVVGGLMDDVDAVIQKARFVPWDYNGALDHHALFVRLDLQPIDKNGKPDGEVYQQFYSAGDLEHYVPSQDGQSPAPGLAHFGEQGNDDTQAEGWFAFKVGKKEGLANTSNWAHFCGSALDAKFPRERFSADIRFFEGTIAHFNRVPQKKRAGLVKATDPTKKAKNDDILVITEMKGFVGGKQVTPAPSPATGSTSSPVPASPVSSSVQAPPASAGASVAAGGGDLDSVLVPIVKAAVVAAANADPNNPGLPKSKLPGAVLANAPGPLKGKGVSRVVAVDFLSAHTDQWAYDADGGVLYNV